jgi:spectinomycin phosphotransferase
MYDEPASLPKDLLAAALHEHWGIDCKLRYAPVGFGSYHWVAEATTGERWFVTADAADGFEALRAAYETAAALRDQGLAFVVAPVTDRTGELVRQITPEWVVALFPYVEGESAGYGNWKGAVGHKKAIELIARLHAAAPPASLRRWDFVVPERDNLVAALADLNKPWDAGPFGEQARLLLNESRGGIEALFRRYDALVAAVGARDDPWVVSHGEPHSANFIAGADGQLYLIDWDTVRLAPRERDLANGLGRDSDVIATYRVAAGPLDLHLDTLELFRAWWHLCEICGYFDRFHRPHEGSLDDEASWKYLHDYLPVESGWPNLGA